MNDQQSRHDFISYARDNQKRQACDLCGELMLTASVCRLDGSICLCQDCYYRMDEMPEGDIKFSIKRFLDGNVL